MNSNIHFPTFVVDDFLEDPDEFREWVLAQDFSVKEGNYPGYRTKNLGEFNPQMMEFLMNRILNIFYHTPTEQPYQWAATIMFQKVPGDEISDSGWIHKDGDSMLTAILYLNKNPSPNSGTSIFTAPTGVTEINTDIKNQWKMDKEYKNALNENNKQFNESINLKPAFNRLVGFDSNRYHSANSFETNDGEDRLTMVVFLRNLYVNYTPMTRLHQMT